MENDANLLVLELSRLQELFKAHLHQLSSGELLKIEMHSSLDKCMSLAGTSNLAAQQTTCTFDVTDIEARMITKKRMTMPKSTTEPRLVVKVGTGDGTDKHFGDGYIWRKYGKKNIKIAKYPRHYYRCTHSETRGCKGKKQVQQSGEKPSTFDVTYIQTHTCYPTAQQQSLNINTQVSGSDLASPSFVFPTTPELASPSFVCPTTPELASPSFVFPTAPESCLDSSAIENCFMGSFSPSPISPEMSGSNHFSLSECEMRGYGEGPSLQAEGSSFADNILAANSAANSPFMGMDLDSMLNLEEFDLCFQFS